MSDVSGSEDEKDHDHTLDLGFLEKPIHPESLLKYHFPCKVGGKPAWLNPRDLPTASQLTCNSCGKMLVFLLQMYAPIETDDRLYHRALFVFICLNGSCLHRLGSIKVVRSQLPEVNPFYPLEPPEIEEEEEEEVDLDNPVEARLNLEDVEWPGAFLCALCGGPGTKKCSRCQSVHYCCRDHQVKDWKLGHNIECKAIAKRREGKSAGTVLNTQRGSGQQQYNEVGSELARRRQAFLFKQKEITLEEEVLDLQLNAREQEMVRKYEAEEEKLSEKQKEQEFKDLTETEQQMQAQVDEVGALKDEVYNTFTERISTNQSQILRYHLGGSPLWVCSDQRPQASDIPTCTCGATRRFEFQIMPQLLDFLIVDSFSHSTIDWGTIAIYTCPDNCGDGLQGYMSEAVWNQRMPELRSDPRVREQLDRLRTKTNQKVEETDEDE